MRYLLLLGVVVIGVRFAKNLIWLYRKGRVSMWREVAIFGFAYAAFGLALHFRTELRSVGIWFSAICFWVPLLVILWRLIRLTGIAEYEALNEDGSMAMSDLEQGS